MRKGLKRFVSVMLMLVFMFMISACSMPNNNADTQQDGNTTDNSNTAGNDHGDDAITVGIAQIQYTSEWRISMTNSIIRALDEAGFNIIYTDAQNDTQKQVSNVEDLLAQDIDYLLLAPNEYNGLSSALESAKAAGVPVILIDRRAAGTAGEDYVCHVGTDQVDQGAKVARWIVEEFDGQAKVVELQGMPASASVIDRGAGFRSVLEDNPGVEIVASQVANDNLTEAQSVMSNILQAQGADNIDVVFCHSSQMAFGAVQAIKEFGLKPGEDIKIATVNGLPNDLKAIIDGDFQCVVACNPLLGDELVNVLNRVIAGETVEELGESIFIEDPVYTIENAEQCLEELQQIIDADAEAAAKVLG